VSLTKSSRPFFNNMINTFVMSGLPSHLALSEACETLGPGTNATSSSLAHTLWALAHNHDFQEKLRQDLADAGFPTDFLSLAKIPRLLACIKEGIRWTGASCGLLPRIVQQEALELPCGVPLPRGVRICPFRRSKAFCPLTNLLDQNFVRTDLVYARQDRLLQP
jgi:cytochrome P450